MLLVTRSDDNEAVDRVARALAKRGRRPVRLDTDRYPVDVELTTRIAPGGVVRRLRTRADDVDVDLDDVSAVWYRRFAAGAGLPEALDDERAACVDEARRALHGTLAALPCLHLDRLEDVRRCDHKELQLVRARGLGLDVPRTLFANDPDAVRAFFDECGGVVVAKMQSSFAVLRAGRENVVFTSAVEREHLDELDRLRFCPMIFQERLARALDVRATVVGERVFAAALRARDGAGGVVDWRVDGAVRLGEWRPHRLPRDVERALVALVRGLGLGYGACDLVVDDDGRHVFLEVNAGGEWLWLDDLLGIAGALADALTDAVAARSVTGRATGGGGRRRRSAPAGTR